MKAMLLEVMRLMFSNLVTNLFLVCILGTAALETISSPKNP